MTAPFKRWTPTKAEAELLIDMLTARLAPAKIAAFLHIDPRTLKGYLVRLEEAAHAPYPEFVPPPPRPPPPATTRIVSDRVFCRED